MEKKKLNLTLGGVILVVGLAAFLFSDTLFGDSELAYNAMFRGLILAPTGLILVIVGLVQYLALAIKEKLQRG
jgi:hypothetical protein